MNVTFLIGNGFDIRLGLNTCYKDIEKEYVKSNYGSEIEGIQAFKESLNDKEYWSDFEVGLGKYTEHFAKSEQEKFKNIEHNFLDFMADYLENEEGKIHFKRCEPEIQDLFMESIEFFCNELPLLNREDVQNIINSFSNPVSFNFISFNYTHILDKCIELTTKKYNEFGTHNYRGVIYKHGVNKKIIHVHGELPDSFMVGVDNNTQLLNKEWIKDNRFCTQMIKPKMNSRIGNKNDLNATALINDSTIFCIFGMSIGETDKTWWKLIGNKLRNNPNSRLIIFANSHIKSKRVIPQDKIEIENNKKDLFMNKAEIPENDRESVENRIHVILDSKKFDINLVKLSEQKKSAVIVN